MNPDGSSPTQLTHRGNDGEGCNTPTFSPDGSSIAYGLGTVGGNFVYSMSSTGANGVEIGTGGLTEPNWSSTPQFSSLTGLTVTVTGTSSADHISIVDDEDSGNLDVTLNGKTETYNDALVQYVYVFCGAGNDSLDASQAPENIYADGGAGNDNLIGGESNDTLTSGAGKNTLYGGDGDDRLNGSGGHDFINGEAGNDRIYGNGGDDILLGGDNTDRIWGGDGDDQISGGNGNDKLYGQAGNDLLQGQNGDDFLDGSPGTDTVNGGNGTDTAYVPVGTTPIHIEIET
jgi:Ca2+-binding RTX toxin-like protein